MHIHILFHRDFVVDENVVSPNNIHGKVLNSVHKETERNSEVFVQSILHDSQ